MEQQIEAFVDYLQNVKKTSENTKQSYRRDLLQMSRFLEKQGIISAEKVKPTNLTSYILKMEQEGHATATISRRIASIKAFFHYLLRQGKIEEEPTKTLKPPKIERMIPDILSIQEVELLLQQPQGDSPKSIRDKAMLELLYATGVRVSELITLKISDVQISMRFLMCHSKKKERVIPFGEEARKALVAYIQTARQDILKEKESDFLFVNCFGEAMSRQGFWKIVKKYAKEAGIRKDITPHTLRHSFAAHLAENGAELKAIQEMMGHADIASTQVYANLSNKRLRDIYTMAHPRS